MHQRKEKKKINKLLHQEPKSIEKKCKKKTKIMSEENVDIKRTIFTR